MLNLLPWNPADMWYPREYAVRRELWVEPEATYGSTPSVIPIVPTGGGNCWSSQTTSPNDDMHIPILDVDHVFDDERNLATTKRIFDTVFGEAPQIWVPSTNNWHVYIGSGPGEPYDKAIPWNTLSQILEWLAVDELIDSRWAQHCLRDQQCILRKPGNMKSSKKSWTCMWCAKEMVTEQELEAHEDECF